MRYEIKGDPFPIVICTLDDGETVACQKGAMAWMSPNMQMSTNAGGGVGKMFSRMVSGESIFQNKYTPKGQGEIAFAPSVPGQIIAIEISPQRNIVAQKSAFLASSETVNYELFFQKKFGAGLFGGEGFIMQRLTGDGVVFLNAGGTIVKKKLEPGQILKIDTGCLVAMSDTVNYDIEFQSSIKNGFFGGEGLFLATLTGPGEVWLQSLPLSRMADRIITASTSYRASDATDTIGDLSKAFNLFK